MVVGQDYLVTLEGPGVTQSACVKVNNVERVVFQWRSGVWSNGFIVAIHLEEGGCNKLGMNFQFILQIINECSVHHLLE